MKPVAKFRGHVEEGNDLTMCCLVQAMLCGLQIWGKVENSFWEALTPLLTPGQRE